MSTGRRGRDIWDEQPTFKRIPEFDDTRPLKELEEILLAAEDKLESMQDQLADEGQLQREQEDNRLRLQNEIDDLTRDRDAKHEEIDNVKDSVHSIKSITTAIQNKIGAIQEEKEHLRATKRKKQQELGLKNGDVPSEEEATKAIKAVEHELETRRTLSLKTEKQYLQKIKKLEHIRDALREQTRYKTKEHEKDDEIKLCQKEMRKVNEDKEELLKKEAQLRDELNAINKKIAGKKRELQHNSRKDLVASERRQYDFVELMSHKVGYRGAKIKFENALEGWEQRKTTYLERRDAEIAVKKERDEAHIDKENPWKEQKAVCEDLTTYLEKIHEEQAALKNAEAEEEEEEEEAQQEKEKDADDKDEKETKDWHEDMPKEKKTQKRQEPLVHDGGKREGFETLKMHAPHYPGQVARALDQLKQRKNWFETAPYTATMPDFRFSRGHKGYKGGKGMKGGRGGKGRKGGGKGRKGW
eukprot:TRINITY_DN879_c1_g1_i1.p1 TRINITY_DN879_c1_g1~~TRINITY_DN879_c1_g1_i1.p1  ORF type:complete len:539 (+),score=177.25 TRINITY_DN879_c1_g1_i1:205-1617(+)